MRPLLVLSAVIRLGLTLVAVAVAASFDLRSAQRDARAMREGPTAELTEMAQLITQRNTLEQCIARLRGRRVSPGGIGEWIAARVFGDQARRAVLHLINSLWASAESQRPPRVT